MALSTEVTTPAPKEKIQHKILAAAKHVRVSEYFQLQYQFNRGLFSKNEYRQISDGVAAIRSDAAESDNRCYDPGDKIEHSADPRIIDARLVLTNVPLLTYLAARHEYLKAAVARSTRNLQELETIKNDLFLTETVAAAAKISLT